MRRLEALRRSVSPTPAPGLEISIKQLMAHGFLRKRPVLESAAAL
jgi:hypothetical protein